MRAPALLLLLLLMLRGPAQQKRNMSACAGSRSQPPARPAPALPQLHEMIEEADRDGDGEINEEEFLRIMKKTSLF